MSTGVVSETTGVGSRPTPLRDSDHPDGPGDEVEPRRGTSVLDGAETGTVEISEGR